MPIIVRVNIDCIDTLDAVSRQVETSLDALIRTTEGRSILVSGTERRPNGNYEVSLTGDLLSVAYVLEDVWGMTDGENIHYINETAEVL